jgi:O-antigen chain-terminating methyltransferase
VDAFVKQRDRLLTGQITRARMLREFLTDKDARPEAQFDGLSWQITQDRIDNSFPARAVRIVAKELHNIYLLPRRFRQLFARVETLEQKTVELASVVEARTRQLTGNFERSIRETKTQIGARADAMDRERYALSARIDSIVSRADVMDQARYALSARTDAIEGQNEKRLRELRTILTEHWRTIVDQKLRMEAILNDAQSALDLRKETPAISIPVGESDRLLDAFYVSFEDRYRGERIKIKNQQRVYLQYIATSVAATGGGSVIDIGCGRGEWLELLAESGFEARGFDLNRIAVEECRERGLDAKLGDAVQALAGTAENHISAITSFHVIEHLPFEAMVSLIDNSFRALRPGGALLFETPNPANLLVAAERFYFDPTHRNPLPSELTSHLLAARGFERVEVLPLHPVDWANGREYDDPMLSFLQDKLFGPQDYGVIGWKPA